MSSFPAEKCCVVLSEAESKEKHDVWDPMLELTITSPYVDCGYNLTLCRLHSRLQHIMYHGQPYARVDLILQSGTLDLALEIS
jgi:hypothetical protein